MPCSSNTPGFPVTADEKWYEILVRANLCLTQHRPCSCGDTKTRSCASWVRDLRVGLHSHSAVRMEKVWGRLSDRMNVSQTLLVGNWSIYPTNRSSRPWNTFLSSRSPSRLSTRHSHLCKHVTLLPPQPPSACPSKKKLVMVRFAPAHTRTTSPLPSLPDPTQATQPLASLPPSRASRTFARLRV